MASQNPTQHLASFVAGATIDDLPDRVRERTKVILLDAFASAFAGRSADESPIVIDTALAAFGPGASTLLSGGTGSQAAATMINGYLITAVTVCDIHIPTVCHVTPEVVPPVLAVAEARDLPGRAVLLATALGLEVTTRVGIGTNYSAFRERGFHSPGVTGVFGGAAAVGSLVGSDASQVTHAFGIAASQAAGTWTQLGTPTIKYQQSRGAVGGLTSALLAEAGLTSTPDAFGAVDGGLFHSYSDGGDPESMLRDLGDHWELENISLRAWPAAAYLQGVVTAVLGLLEQEAVDPSAVERLTVRISPNAYALHGERRPKDRFEARLTARYVAAVVLHDRACWMDQFTAERFADPDLTAWTWDRVDVIRQEGLHDAGAIVEAALADGRTISFDAVVPKGDPEAPLSFDDVVTKLRSATAGAGMDDAVSGLIDAIGDIEATPSLRPVLTGVRTPQTG